jgi:predicted transposase YbfD/YdcC
MRKDPASSISSYFGKIVDPRVARTRLHSLHDILVITICAVVGGADDWVNIEQFARAKRRWFKSFLDLPHGIPSHDTLGRVFAMLDPEELSRCFASWIASIAKLTDGEVVAIDGKTLRRSFDAASNKSAIHMVSAWATENRLVLGQLKTSDHSNEITVIPKLLDLLALEGCIVTMDAMGCQKEIVAKIVEKKADYVICLKGNQRTMHEEVKEFFDDAFQMNFREMAHDYAETVDGDHGRIETRRCWSTSEIDWFVPRHSWKGLRSIALIEAERTLGDKTSVERRVFISSLAGESAEKIASAARKHWAIENSLHWVLDVAFREDESRARKDHSAENLATIRHIAMNLLKQDTSAKVGVKGRRLMAGWDERYLFRVLTGS